MAGFRPGSVFGIEIRIDVSWSVIFFLVLWTLTRGVFPAAVPRLSPAVYVTMGLVGTLLLSASLLAHEMAHSLVARRLGLAVSGITLFILGGIARAAAEFRSPREELIVAAAGPLSSFAIAAMFQIVALMVTAAGMPPAMAAVAAYLALINLILAVFNVFPGLPLDGGRILRSIVWHRTRDVLRATRGRELRTLGRPHCCRCGGEGGPGNVVAPADELPAALEKLAGSAAGRVLVTHGGRLVGILSHTDVSRCVEKERLRAQLNG